MKKQQAGHLCVLQQTQLFLIAPAEGNLLCRVVQAKWAQCTSTTLEDQTLVRSETEEAPQNINCLPLAQQQRGETPLGWVNRKLCAILQTFSRVSLLDQG